ncbi:MAG: entericidin, EcnA/B family [Rhodobacteraceae bacterium]|jgi:predicted small secreted protein|nr:entericidin, EcnA/B family [Paracoccaceae bacterium]
MVRILTFSILMLLSACNTVEGIGMDISAGARRVGNAF